jgi:hypothetical protein
VKDENEMVWGQIIDCLYEVVRRPDDNHENLILVEGLPGNRIAKDAEEKKFVA